MRFCFRFYVFFGSSNVILSIPLCFAHCFSSVSLMLFPFRYSSDLDIECWTLMCGACACVCLSFPKSETLIIVLWIFDLISILGSKTTIPSTLNFPHRTYTQTLWHLALLLYVNSCPISSLPTIIVCCAGVRRNCSCNPSYISTQKSSSRKTPSTPSCWKQLSTFGARRQRLNKLYKLIEKFSIRKSNRNYFYDSEYICTQNVAMPLSNRSRRNLGIWVFIEMECVCDLFQIVPCHQ